MADPVQKHSFKLRGYLTAILLSIGIILLFRFVNINMFTLDLARTVSERRFIIFSLGLPIDPDVVILNIGKTPPDQIESEILRLLEYEPKIIGVNVCHLDRKQRESLKRLNQNKRVVICNCEESGKFISSIRIDANNKVTHFKADNSDYFEIRLSEAWKNLKQRGHDLERISYRAPMESFYQLDLAKSENFLSEESVRDKIFLVGYTGEYVTEDIFDFTNVRITPMNTYYGEEYLVPDMYDLQISALIVSMIKEGRFVNEVNSFLRIAILFLFCLLNVAVISLIQTKWLVLNLFIYLIWFIILSVSGPALIVFLHEKNYYLQLNEITVLLIITSVSTIILNLMERQNIVAKIPPAGSKEVIDR